MWLVNGLLNTLLIFCSLFLICLVLIQRGKGGGLAGAFGAVGGSSAFGTKAGDVFTRVTIITAGVWFALAMLLVVITNRSNSSAWVDDPTGPPGTSQSQPAKPGGASRTGPAAPVEKGPSSAFPERATPAPATAPPTGTPPPIEPASGATPAPAAASSPTPPPSKTP